MYNAKQRKIYDDKSTGRILELVKNKQYGVATAEFEKYLDEFPNDVSMYLYYIDLLISNGDLSKAEEMLQTIPSIKKNLSERIERKRRDCTLLKIRILSFSGKYEECYQLVKNNFPILRDLSGSEHGAFYLFLKKQLNLITEEDYTKLYYQSYLAKQILDYHEDLTLEQIRKHFVIQNEEPFFSESFPLENVYQELRKQLPSFPRRNATLFQNHYIMRYDYNGYSNHTPTHYLDVVTLNNTNDVIKISPYENKERQPYIDLNFIREEEKTKVKRMSQIDKFNQRYWKIVDKK